MSGSNIEDRARSLHAWDARIRLLQEHDRRGAELDALKAKLRDPAVAAVVELAEQCDREHRRAEAAHDAKDEANRRWLAAAEVVEAAKAAAANILEVHPQIKDAQEGWFHDSTLRLVTAVERLETTE